MGREKIQRRDHVLEYELGIARKRWAERWNPELEQRLRALLGRTGLQVSNHELQLLDGVLYVNHAGLLRLARTNRCAGITTEILKSLSQPEQRRWVVKATVFKSARSRHGFVGFGDADPSNISSLVRGSELRVAETRAVNRALRKAYAIGLCSAEEIGGSTENALSSAVPNLEDSAKEPSRPSTVLNMTVGDRLKLVLREHQLDPVQVLHYAYRFLGISDLKAAPTSELERFASHLEQFAIANRTWLQAELTRVSQSAESEYRGEESKETIEAA